MLSSCSQVRKMIEELADATLGGTQKEYMAAMTKVPLLIVDDLGILK